MKKTNWQTKKLGEICKKASSNISQNQLSDNNGEFPIYGASGLIKNVDFYHQEKEYISIVKDGAGIGRLALLPAKSSIIGTLQYILPQEGVDIKFLYYSLLSVDFLKHRQGSTIPHIYFKDYSEEEIIVPPLHEQLRIVSILDEALEKLNQARKNIEKNLQNTKDIFESYLQNVFANPWKDWEEKMLVEITSHLGDGLHGTPKYTENGEYYFINGNNLNDWVIRFKEWTKRVSIEEFNKYKKNLTNSTILVSINGTLGNVAFYNNEKIILGKSACYFNLSETVDKFYIKYIFSSQHFSKYAHKEATGATIKNVSLKTMREFKIPLPKLAEQRNIVCKLNSLSTETKRLESIYQQKLAHLDELRKSLLQKAFNGEL
ncbi:MAG: hypothetical protein ACD_71C00218G0004 [uncultured bacterium (gcode 4)]|uniref:Type I restriction modification DNA specificity domain-containing protein n=1 Tax=uncultured bacterium (gcode 4) TaxID=1234023 RepID=K2A2I7_9BACT|nr:MAG: hypothetical protein ACD_71C00218G0004 [uncultured bacterium (gcode 4)]